MSVRNINQGYYDLPAIDIPETLTFTGAATITVPVIFRTINGTVQLYIGTFNTVATGAGYLTTTIPTRFLKDGSTAMMVFNVIAIQATDTTPGGFSLNCATGELRLYPDPLLFKIWTVGQTMGLFDNATLVWNMI